MFALPRSLVTRGNLVLVMGLGLVAAYLAGLTVAMDRWPYHRWMVLVLTPVLLAVGAAIVIAVTRRDPQPLTSLILIALVVKVGAAFVRYVVTFSIYGSGDAKAYDFFGTEIANAYHRGETSIVDLLTMRQGTRFIDDLTGLFYAITGPSRIGGFVLYSWIGFWGLFCFHRAALVGMPEGDQRRYALLIFFIPSLLFWPSSIGKEAVMMLALGLCALGTARVLEHRQGGWPILVAGLGLGYMVRPHVSLVVLGALAVALVFRPRTRSVFGPVGRIVVLVVLVASMAFVLSQAADRLLPGTESTGVAVVGDLLDRASTGTDEGGSAIDRPSPNNPLQYPGAVFTVLFRPTLVEADSAGDLIAAAETTFVLVLAIVSWRRLRNVVSLAVRRPYVTFCVVYSAVFTFAWSSFSNLGALARQRVQVWPFVLLLLALPRTVPGRPAKHERAAALASTSTPRG